MGRNFISLYPSWDVQSGFEREAAQRGFARAEELFLKHTDQPTAQSTTTKTYQIILPYLGIFTSRAEKKIKRALTEHLPGVKVTFVYRASTRLRSLFSFKDKIPTYLRSGIIYKYTCNSCNAVYIGESFRHQHTRFCEHIGISALTGKELACKKESPIRDHLQHCNGTITDDCFKIIGREAELIARRVKESLFIHRDEPSLNVQGTSIPLKLFKNWHCPRGGFHIVSDSWFKLIYCSINLDNENGNSALLKA